MMTDAGEGINDKNKEPNSMIAPDEHLPQGLLKNRYTGVAFKSYTHFVHVNHRRELGREQFDEEEDENRRKE